MQKVTAIQPEQQDGFVGKNRKEKGFFKQHSLVDLESGKELITARFYLTKSRVYCCVWIQRPDQNISGGGFAGGYGYHKASAAFESATDAAGISFASPVAGRGMTL